MTKRRSQRIDGWLPVGTAILLISTFLAGCFSTGTTTEPTPSAVQPSSTATEVPTTPIARAYAVMADMPGVGIMLFGGQFGVPPGTPLSDLWSFSPDGGWVQIAPETGHGTDAWAYDSREQVLVSVEQDDTWSYDPSTGEWLALETEDHPRDLLGARIAYDSGSDRIILFGGFETIGDRTPATWALDVTGGTWTQMDPRASPPGRNFHAMAYDPRADRVILFGGTASPSTVWRDTWAYDYDADTWTELSTKQGPAPRNYSAMVYDPVGRRMILFGGVDASEAPFGDTWAYDPRTNQWVDLEPDAAPSPRGWHSMALDTETGMIVLFSGGETRDTDLDDVWLFDPSSDTWSQVA
jgi:N-acetylneuraminic acid mutarotase